MVTPVGHPGTTTLYAGSRRAFGNSRPVSRWPDGAWPVCWVGCGKLARGENHLRLERRGGVEECVKYTFLIPDGFGCDQGQGLTVARRSGKLLICALPAKLAAVGLKRRARPGFARPFYEVCLRGGNSAIDSHLADQRTAWRNEAGRGLRRF